MTSLMEGSGLDVQAFQPMACYLNGEYWGFYNIREKLNEHYVESKKGVNSDDVTFLEIRGAAKTGNNKEYLDLYDFIEENNLTDEENYTYVSDRIDIENFIMYQVAQIFVCNTDWPGNNIKYWNSPDTKWQWLLFDMDFGFDFSFWNPTEVNHNTLAHALASNGPNWPNPPWSTLILRKLIVNLEFRNAFVNRFADELNSRFLPDNVTAKLDSVVAIVSNEMPKHVDRWGGSMYTWNDEIDKIKTFAQARTENVKNHIRGRLNLLFPVSPNHLRSHT